MTWRDMMCGEPRPEHVGRRITLAGWAHRRRDHGGLVFIDLRDHTGLCQLVVNPEHAQAAAEVAHDVRNEFVLRAEGELVARAPELVNPNIPTGEVELRVETLEVVSSSPPLPFQLDEEGVDELLRLRYRWLDLRRDRCSGTSGSRTPSSPRSGDRWRTRVSSTSRRRTHASPTPEGARDFLVPVRLQPGTFFALAQSPQLFKQLFMVGGFDRYYQIAICWRDEDLRADRQFEFHQLDVEMAFPDRESSRPHGASRRPSGGSASTGEPAGRFRRLAYADAMLRYGTDKPDLRFGLEIQDATEITRGSEFGVFGSAPAVRFLVVPQQLLPRRAERAGRGRKGVGCEGARLSRVRRSASCARRSRSSSRRPSSMRSARRRRDRALRRGQAGSVSACSARFGSISAGSSISSTSRRRLPWVWILDFPLFHWTKRRRPLEAIHHPFTGPLRREEQIEAEPARASQHYDLVWNGNELGGARSGSTRSLQARVFGVWAVRRGSDRSSASSSRRCDGRSATRRVRDGHRPLSWRCRGSPTCATRRVSEDQAAPIR